MASAAGSGLAWRQLKLQRRSGERRDRSAWDVPGTSVVPPTGRLPRTVRGRDAVLGDLWRLLWRPDGQFVVLAGMGGVGKSTVAAALAKRARDTRVWIRRRPPVWWVSVADPVSLTEAMAAVGRQLGAPGADVEAIASGRPDAPDRLWSHLGRVRRRWLLVLDNADDPEVLARPVRSASGRGSTAAGPPAPGDGDGWLRPSRRGLVVVTSRDGTATTWGSHARVLHLEPLGELDASRVLLDWAPAAGGQEQARRLARRLGCLPLALGLAGSYLQSDVVLRASFPRYQQSLDGPDEAARLLAGGLAAGAESGAIVMRTWELSLDALARRGVPQTRALLRLLSCYAASTPIPLDLLDPRRLAPLLASGDGATTEAVERQVEAGLLQLRRLGLIEARPPVPNGQQAVAIHPVIADTNRFHLAAGTGVDAAAVRRTSAQLVVAALGDLDREDPDDWPRYRLLAPHLHALLATVASHLDRADLGALVEAAATAASAHDRAGALAEGERLSRATFALLPALDDDNATVLVRHYFAWELAIGGRLGEAEAIHRDLLAVRERRLGADHPDTLMSRQELAWVAAGQGRWSEAEAAYRDVLASCIRVLGDEELQTLVTRHELAWVMASRGRGAEAAGELRSVVEARTRRLGRDHPRTLASRHELAWAIAVDGRWGAAEDAYQDVLAARRRILGVEHPETLTTRHELQWVVAMRGGIDDALAGYAEVLAARERALGPEHPDTLTTRHSLERLRAGETVPARHLA